MAVVEDIIVEVGQLGIWLQALGILTIFFIIFDIIAFIINRRRLKEIHIIKKDMARIEGKIDRILKRK